VGGVGNPRAFAAARSSIEVRFSLRNRFYARAIAERIKSPSEIERADQDGGSLPANFDEHATMEKTAARTGNKRD
jgi:hypothetical protein